MKYNELVKKYNVITDRHVQKGDLVYVSSQGKVFEVIEAYTGLVKIKIDDRVTMTLPLSQYRIVEEKKKPSQE